MGREHYQGIAIAISSAMAREALSAFPDAAWTQAFHPWLLLRDDNEVTIYFGQLDEPQKDWLYKKLTEAGNVIAANTVASLRQAEKDSPNIVITTLDRFLQALGQYLLHEMIDGWVYSIGGKGEQMPWLVNSISLQESRTAPPNVAVQLVANSPQLSLDYMQRPVSRFLYFFDDDLAPQRIPDILAAKGYIRETPELKTQYLASVEKFSDYFVKQNEQFVAVRGGIEVDFEKGNRNSERVAFRQPVRVVNDEGIMQRKFFMQLNSPLWSRFGKAYSEIPLHPKIFCFNLETHTNVWVHVNNLTEYVYNPDLRDKLVLPQDHRDLVDILTQDMDVLMEDIIPGKSGGTTILCKGAPGLGKTLTAEVYAEIAKRPLYRVHSGQLGVMSDEVEKSLDKILKRAQRWGAVMLIDEADVYIRQRDHDIDHNAVVAAFLRTLEYFHGLLFLTTNRADDVDDAIASRCIATIVYRPPVPEDAMRIWKVLAGQFEISLSEEQIADLAGHFDGISGRDIKELLKLTAKWCRQKNVEPSLEVFRSCAQFRSL